MEREIVYKNLEVLKRAVMEHQEILVDKDNEDILTAVSSKQWEEMKDTKRKNRSKFVVSKTIAFCPSVFEEDTAMKESILAITSELMSYFNDHQMGPLAELMQEYIKNEKSKDALLFDYHYKQGS